MIHIYTLRCVATGAVYVGKTRKPVARRFTEHKRDAKTGGTRPLHKALRRYKRWTVHHYISVHYEETADKFEASTLDYAKRQGLPILNVAPAGGGGRGRAGQ